MAWQFFAGNLALEVLAELVFSKELNAGEAATLAELVKNKGNSLKVTENKDGKIKVKPVKNGKKYIPEFKTKMPPKKYAKGGGIKKRPARKAKIAKVMKRKTRKT